MQLEDLSPVPASVLRARLADQKPVLPRLQEVYGTDPETITGRLQAILETLDLFLDRFGDRPCAIFRAPARLSLNPHCDHQGAWVPYALHLRELLAVVSPTEEDRVEVANTNPAFAPLLSFSIAEEIRRDPAAWEEGWFHYIEAPAVAAEVRRLLDSKGQTSARSATLNYIKAAVLRVHSAFPDANLPGLRIALNGNIPEASGMSSSSALVTAAVLAVLESYPDQGFPGHSLDRRLLAEQLGEAEWYVGTRGGSGDHAAMLLGSCDGLTHLRFRAPFEIREIRRSPFPPGCELIVANSLSRSEKSAEERRLFNRGIFAYRFAFLALRQAMQDLDLPEEIIRNTECLGDLHTDRLSLAVLYQLILRLPVSITPTMLADQFPEAFAPAARGCFGTDDLSQVPAEIPLRGAAVYGLGRVDRGRVMPDLLDEGTKASVEEFGRLMSITHDGDRSLMHGREFTTGRDRLSDEQLHASLAAVIAGEDHPLRHEPGFYGASTPELDRMVDIARSIEGVSGAGLMGAGGGGCILILARSGLLEVVRAALSRDYYQPVGREPAVEIWQPAPAAGRLL